VYTGSTNDLNIRHNTAIAHMNLMNLYQDKIGLLSTIEKLMYAGGTYELNFRHNKALADMNL